MLGRTVGHREPLAFFALSALIAGLLLCIWDPVSRLYLQAVTPVVNLWFSSCGMPLTYHMIADALVLAVGEPGSTRYLGLEGEGHTKTIAALALFASTPRMTLSWRLTWTAGAAAACWVSDILSLGLAGLLGVHAYLHGLDVAERVLVLDVGWGVSIPTVSEWHLGLFQFWYGWGCSAVLLLLWIVAVRWGRRV